MPGLLPKIFLKFLKKFLTNIKKYDNIIPERKKKGNKKMFYWFTFEDGYSICVRGFSKRELAWEVRKHGKLIGKERA